jgi:hypothetical protein
MLVAGAEPKLFGKKHKFLLRPYALVVQYSPYVSHESRVG